MKKILCLLLCALLLCGTVLPVFAADQPYADSRYFTCGDYRLHYRILPAEGTEKGKILMLHGFLCSTYAWRNMAPLLCAEGYTCVLVDLPDFGYSTRETKETTVVPRDTLVKALMTSIAPAEEWIVAGHSMGGGVAIDLATALPIKALLLYCPCPWDGMPAWTKPLMTSRGMETAMDLLFAYGTKCTPLVRLVLYAATNDWDFSMRYDVSGVTVPVQTDHFGAGLCEMMYNAPATKLDHAAEIRCPVLLVQADHDVILNRQIKDRVNAALPQATAYLVKGGGHQCIENRAAELVTVTCGFLQNNQL